MDLQESHCKNSDCAAQHDHSTGARIIAVHIDDADHTVGLNQLFCDDLEELGYNLGQREIAGISRA